MYGVGSRKVLPSPPDRRRADPGVRGELPAGRVAIGRHPLGGATTVFQQWMLVTNSRLTGFFFFSIAMEDPKRQSLEEYVRKKVQVWAREQKGRGGKALEANQSS